MDFVHLPHDKKIDRYSFNFQSLIGKGSFSKVYLGTDSVEGHLVAIKIIDISLLLQAHLSTLLQNEITIMKKLEHPNVLKLYEVLTTQNNIYIVTEYCNEGDLSHILKKKGKLTENETLAILTDILEGFKEILKYGVIHRDLKPANFFIHNGIFKIGDFGFAKRVRGLDEPIVTQMVGTPLYMAPQGMQGLPYTSKSDIYSIGIILYECLVGKTPWPAQSQYDLMRNMRTMPLTFPSSVSISSDMKNLIIAATNYDERGRLSWAALYATPLVQRLFSKKMFPSSNLANNIKGFLNGKIIKTEIPEIQKTISYNFHQITTEPEIKRETIEVEYQNANFDFLTKKSIEFSSFLKDGDLMNLEIQPLLLSKIRFLLLKLEIACSPKELDSTQSQKLMEENFNDFKLLNKENCEGNNLYSFMKTDLKTLLPILIQNLSRFGRILNHFVRLHVKNWNSLPSVHKFCLCLLNSCVSLIVTLENVKTKGNHFSERGFESSQFLPNRECYTKIREKLYELNI